MSSDVDDVWCNFCGRPRSEHGGPNGDQCPHPVMPDRRAATLAHIQQQRDDRVAWRAGGGLFRETTLFASLGVAVKAGSVWRPPGILRPARLGPLAGAEALVTDGTRAHRVGAGAAGFALTGGAALGLLPALTTKSKAAAMVVLPDGTVHQQKLNSNGAIRRAQAEAVRFNAMARAAGPAETRSDERSPMDHCNYCGRPRNEHGGASDEQCPR